MLAELVFQLEHHAKGQPMPRAAGRRRRVTGQGSIRAVALATAALPRQAESARMPFRSGGVGPYVLAFRKFFRVEYGRMVARASLPAVRIGLEEVLAGCQVHNARITDEFAALLSCLCSSVSGSLRQCPSGLEAPGLIW